MKRFKILSGGEGEEKNILAHMVSGSKNSHKSWEEKFAYVLQ
jgi:hypothetical protein